MPNKILRGIDRQLLIEELHKRYGQSSSRRAKWRYWRKKYSWLAVVALVTTLKRIFDIVISGILVIFLSPLFFVISILIKMTDPGPVLYVSNRVGKWGKEFRFPKFRTMTLNADKRQKELQKFNAFESDIKFKMKNDPRITSFGRILRKTSMDELPQLWCVLKGDMSLVGPRPPLPKEVAMYTIEQRKRLDVTPGITCFWQVSGRSELSFEQQVKLDVQYIESQSFWLDIKLLLKTIPAVLFGKGAY